MKDNTHNKFKIFFDKLGMSKNKLSKEIDCSRMIITMWIKGTRKPSFKNCKKLINLAKAYKIDVDYEDLRDVE